VTNEDDSVSTIPGTAFDPIDGVEKGGSGTIARVLAIDALNIMVSVLSLDGFRFISDSFSTSFETTDGFVVDKYVFEQSTNTCK
jgi:hypothetical protein